MTELVVTAEKREQAIQHVAIAITAFTAAKRDQMGINTIQDMTNFTPGLSYSTSTDRITLRGVGRTTNVLSADAPVANYDDGLYETFAVAAGRSSLELAQVVVQRGPQGTLGGRNALAGSLDEVTQRPTSTQQGEFRWTVGNYGHLTAEAAFSGPLGKSDVWQYRIYGNWDYQSKGYINNVIPGMASEGNNINTWYVDFQIQAHFNDRLDMWTKIQGAQWFNASGGPGDQSAGWTRLGGYPSYQFSVASTVPNGGYACAPGAAANGVTSVVNVSPLGCFNPAINSPWSEAEQIDHQVELPVYISLNSQWTWHNDGFDIKYIGGGTYYHYALFGPTGGSNSPIIAYNEPSGQTIHSSDSFEYQEFNGFWSDELNFISTDNGPLQWVAGVYQFYQHYQQPVSAENLQQPEYRGPLLAPGVFCPFTAGVCAPVFGSRWFDNRPDVQDQSYAAYGQIDYKFTPQWKLTLGVRYSYDKKYGTESVRLLCFALPACLGGLPPEFFAAPVDLTQTPTVVDAGPPFNPLPKGVTGPTTYGTKYAGLATRGYNSSWEAPSGTAGIEWTPDNDSLYYFKYGRGYKSGGYNIGIFTVLSFQPWTDAEHVDSFEIGAKHTFGHWLTADVAAFYYSYSNLQIPLSTIQTAGGLAQSETAFYNVPESVSEGVELETTWTPIDHLSILFNYSFNDAHVTRGQGADPADPNAIQPGAKPLFTPAQCMATAGAAHPDCTVDVYTATLNQVTAVAAATGIPLSVSHPNTLFTNALIPGNPNQGWNIPQNLAGNPLPNAPRNKVAINILYDYKTDSGIKIQPSLSWVWRDSQYGLFFKDPNYIAPSWDEWDARVTVASPNDRFEAIFFIKNIANTVGYDQGALAFRAAGTVDTAASGFQAVNYVQGMNGPAGFNTHLAGTDKFGVFQTLYVIPPRTYGIELHYKFW
ncbi:MAG TPA: TonB-dependent receptor [Caulobacteraceae bacterium]|nr:TonB-dependent receptor [Caulobacteraceae bacterium]